MEVDKIIISPQFRYSKQYIEVMKVIIENNKKGKKTDVIYGINGGIIKCGKYFNMKIYGPINKYITKNILNNNSLVFLATIGNKKILYTGDIEKIPFVLAYAVSIHKSQGLEYDSVKIVITREIEENISHNIFYTAITRAKKYLKIYWSPETQQYIIKNFNIKNNKIDVSILKAKERI